MTTLASELAKGLKETHTSVSGKPLFFDKDSLAYKFADQFSIPENDRSNFYEAFKIVTQGQGNELSKINSVISSSLLSLLTFYQLFKNTDKNKYIEIAGDRYYKCFFEVKNEVIRNPSCVDVALVSTDEKKMLFLESKLSEYADYLKSRKEYGKGYKSLYEDHGLFACALSGHLRLGESKNYLILKSPADGVKIYIEGIKQTISHLIGLVRGPEYRAQGYYPEYYYKEYKNYYDNAEVIQYATILFDPAKFGVNKYEYKAYRDLYHNTIISHRDAILDCIIDWNKGENNKTIQILSTILTYQELFSDEHNKQLLSAPVQEFYRLM